MQETRAYKGATTQAVRDSFAADAASAAGFVPGERRWIGVNELVVTYTRQDTPAAPGPQRGRALLGSVLLGVVAAIVVGFVASILLGAVTDGDIALLIALLVGPISGAVVVVRRSRRSGWVSFIFMFVAVSAIPLLVALAVGVVLVVLVAFVLDSML